MSEKKFYPLINNQFAIFDELFKEYYWTLNENHIDRVVYLKPGCELDTFEIKLDKDSIYVSAPIKNCDFLYRARFSDFISAFDYVERRVLELNSASS